MPPHLPHAFFIEGGALAVENALKIAFDWKVRRNLREGDPGHEGPADPPLPRGVPRPQRLHAVADEHRPGQDRLLPEVSLAAHLEPQAALPRDAGGRARRDRRRAAGGRGDPAGVRGQPRRHRRRSSSSRSRRRAATTTSAPSSCARCRRSATSTPACFILDEVQTGIGITGRMWAHEHWDLRPDVVAFGKKTQVCGCLAGPRVDEEPQNVFQRRLAHQLDLGRRAHRHGALRALPRDHRGGAPRRERARRRRAPAARPASRSRPARTD